MRRQIRERSERGAVAVLFAALVLVLFGVAALGVDLASQVNRKHLLVNQLDSSATAAAAKLGESGSIAAAVQAAVDYFAQSGQGTLDTSKIDFWCVVAQKQNSTPRVADAQIPTTAQAGGVCNPDAVAGEDGKWLSTSYANRPRASDSKQFSMSCNGTLCAVPCALKAQAATGWNPGNSTYNTRPIKCNTIRVGAEQNVPFSFAPVFGVDQGSTGSQIAVACAGSCGTVAPNPMDVVVVADRTRSMLVPFGCSKGSPGCTDYRSSLVSGIKGMLQVMTPEQQYVAFGALGPSTKARSAAESKACTNNSTTGQGLIYPSGTEYVKLPSTPSATGSWIPIQFKKDYLGSPDVNGVRAVNSGSSLIKAVECLDDYEPSTRTALASPLKAAARYLLGKPGDENNISALGGGDRAGSIKKVIIFETDGQPWENATSTAGSPTLDNNNDVFSKYTDFTTSTYTAPTPVLGSAQNGDPRALDPDPPNPYNQASTYPATYSQSGTHNYTYKYRTSTTTTTNTYTYTGGQKACQNFKDVAQLAKNQGILIITIGYNLGGAVCSGENDEANLPDPPDPTTGTPWISDIQPVACRQGGAGTQANPYTKKTSCAQNMTITYTVPRVVTVNTAAQGPGDASVTDVLAAASGGGDVPTASSNGCADATSRAAENADEDLFFCAAAGQDLAPLFITALSKVTKGVKLMNLP